MQNPEISVVIPVFNSGSILSELNRRINNALVDFSFQIIYVNDCSEDNSLEFLEKFAKEAKNIIAIDLMKNVGKDNAIIAGLRIVKGNYIIIMDDDLQHAPENIPDLLIKCKEGFDVCFASFDKKKHSFIKKAGSKLNGRVASWLLIKPKGIYLSPFKIMRAEIAAEICRFTTPFVYINGIILTITHNICQIDIPHYKRFSGKGNYTIYKSVLEIIKLFSGFSIAPLRIATVFGLIISLIGFGLILLYLYKYFFSSNYVAGWTTLVVLILFFGGLIVMLLGLIGEYIGRIFLTLSNKPQYLIKKIINNENDEQPNS